MTYRKEIHQLNSGELQLNRIQLALSHFFWWVAERLVLFVFTEECRKAEARYQRDKLENLVDGFTIQPREPGEQQQAYAEMMQAHYDKIPVKGDERVQLLEKCWGLENA